MPPLDDLRLDFTVEASKLAKVLDNMIPLYIVHLIPPAGLNPTT